MKNEPKIILRNILVSTTENPNTVNNSIIGNEKDSSLDAINQSYLKYKGKNKTRFANPVIE